MGIQGDAMGRLGEWQRLILDGRGLLGSDGAPVGRRPADMSDVVVETFGNK